ncbi:MAG: YdeI/OmpD-associated family protein [Vicinamibacterales bacterium]
MPRRDPRVDTYISQAAPFARPVLRRLRKVVHAGCPGVQETIKWGMPHFDYKGPLCGMAAFRQHATFGFWKASLLRGHGLPAPARKAMGQFGCLTSTKDLPSEAHLVALVRAAAALNDAGVKVARKAPVKKAPVRVPAALAAAFARHPKARRAFEAFSPSHRREYVEWITEARREETRDRRVATAIAWLAEGKSRNWKYERGAAAGRAKG